jgi:hypothetical protein
VDLLILRHSHYAPPRWVFLVKNDCQINLVNLVVGLTIYTYLRCISKLCVALGDLALADVQAWSSVNTLFGDSFGEERKLIYYNGKH